MYAIIATGGKQYTVSEGDTIRVEMFYVWVTTLLLLQLYGR